MTMSSTHVASSPVQGVSQPARAAARSNDRPLAALLLAAAVAALAVAVDQLVGTWADEHLLAAWVGMWAVVFAGSLLLAGTAQRLSRRLMVRLDGWAQRRAQARADARFMQLARLDSRVMAELQMAQDVSQQASDTATLLPGTATTPAKATAMDEAAARWYSQYRHTFYI